MKKQMKKSEEYFSFNVNDLFLVKLDDKGFKFWKREEEQWITKMETHPPKDKYESESFEDYQKRLKEYEKYVKHLKEIGVHPLSWYKKKADKNGYVPFQAWQFIEIFGKYTTLGCESIYNTDILIKKSDLKPVK